MNQSLICIMKTENKLLDEKVTFDLIGNRIKLCA